VLDPDLQADIAEFQRVSRSILDDHTSIDLSLVRRFPSHALQFLYDALANPSPGIRDGLAPVAKRIDELANAPAATPLLAKRVDPFAATTDVLCKNDVYAVACVPQAWRAARQLLDAGAIGEAITLAELARDHALREHLAVDYELLAEIHRKADRRALARADLAEAKLANP
jgi:hypothetical protein